MGDLLFQLGLYIRLHDTASLYYWLSTVSLIERGKQVLENKLLTLTVRVPLHNRRCEKEPPLRFDPSLPLEHDYGLTCQRFVAIGFTLRQSAASLAAAPPTLSAAEEKEFLMQKWPGIFTKNASRKE